MKKKKQLLKKHMLPVCDECSVVLMPVELAFYENICGKCNQKHNEAALALLGPMLINLQDNQPRGGK